MEKVNHIPGAFRGERRSGWLSASCPLFPLGAQDQVASLATTETVRSCSQALSIIRRAQGTPRYFTIIDCKIFPTNDRSICV